MSHFTHSDRQLTGWAAVLGGALSLVMVGLYFVYSGPPPASNVLSRNLLTVATFTAFLVFAVGLGRMVRSEGNGDAGMAGQIATTALLTYIAVTLVATSLEVGTSLQHPNGSLDPTVDGPLAAGMVLLHGPVARVLVATFLLALTVALSGRDRVPRWVLRGSVVLAIANLALIPSLFFGMDATQFYAANGWAQSPASEPSMCCGSPCSVAPSCAAAAEHPVTTGRSTRSPERLGPNGHARRVRGAYSPAG